MFVVLWDMTKCSVVNLHWYFRRISYFHLQVRSDTENGGSMYLQCWNPPTKLYSVTFQKTIS